MKCMFGLNGLDFYIFNFYLMCFLKDLKVEIIE